MNCIIQTKSLYMIDLNGCGCDSVGLYRLSALMADICISNRTQFGRQCERVYALVVNVFVCVCVISAPDMPSIWMIFNGKFV